MENLKEIKIRGNNTLAEKTEPCPLCGTMLPYKKWLKVVGVYEAQQRYKKELEEKLKQAKEQKNKLIIEYRKIRQKEKELKLQTAQKLQAERKKIRKIYSNLKAKEKNLKAEFEKKFRLQQEKLKAKYEKAVDQVRKEGIKIGAQKEKAKAEKLRNQLDKIKQTYELSKLKLKEKLEREKQVALEKLEREKQMELKRVRREALKAGIEKQKAQTQRMEKLLEKYRKARDEAIERARQYEEMLKKGTTPQVEGFDFEKELAHQLKHAFPKDEIKTTGKKGDIIQTIKSEGKPIGKIIYECKKTHKFHNKFVEQIRRDKIRATADYGVIVTWAFKENRQGFWLEGDIIIVHPFGVLDVATFLREILIQMYSLKLSKSELETKGKSLLEFMQSDDFRSRIQDSIEMSRNAYEILQKEVKTHVNTWKKRFKIYETIFQNTGAIRDIVRYVLLHGTIPKGLPANREFPMLPPVAIKK